MSVQKDKRREGKLALAVLARNHAKYVIQITANDKVFKPQYKYSVTDGLVTLAKAIYRCIWTANNIRVNSKEDYDERREYQKKAALFCSSLLAEMEIAQSVFHISGKRMRYWTGMVTEIKNKTQAWIQSDAKRYEEYR